MKTVTKWGIMAAVQTAVDTPTALVPANHAIRTTEFANVQVKYSYDGARPGKAPGTAARLARVGAEGRYAEFQLKQEGGGGGAAYSATVVPVPHVLLRLSGFDAVLNAGTSYVYTPADEPNYTFGTIESYERGQKYAM